MTYYLNSTLHAARNKEKYLQIKQKATHKMFSNIVFIVTCEQKTSRTANYMYMG